MRRLIEHLREKPPHIKNSYAFFSAVVVTMIAGGMWALSLPARISQTLEVVTVPDEQVRESATILRDLAGEAQNQFGAVAGALRKETPETTSADNVVDSTPNKVPARTLPPNVITIPDSPKALFSDEEKARVDASRATDETTDSNDVLPGNQSGLRTILNNSSSDHKTE